VTGRSDTVRFELPLVLYRCDSTADLLLEGIRGGYGVLVWLRLRDSLAGELPIVGLRDTITRPGAVVAIRYNHQAQVHSFSLDSGSVTVNDSGGARRVAITGSGLEVVFGARSGVAASIASLPAPAESTLSCAPVR
jgi:hypothetical protein